MNAEPMPPAISIVACLMAFCVSSADLFGFLVSLSGLTEHVPMSLFEVREARHVPQPLTVLSSSKLLRCENDLLLHRHVRIIADAERPVPVWLNSADSLTSGAKHADACSSQCASTRGHYLKQVDIL